MCYEVVCPNPACKKMAMLRWADEGWSLDLICEACNLNEGVAETEDPITARHNKEACDCEY